MTKRLVSAFIVTLVIVGAISCSRDMRTLEQRLEGALGAGLRKYDVKGASAALVFPDQSVSPVVSGLSHGSEPVRPDMLFAIGSITKNMVAALVLQLVEERDITFLPRASHESITYGSAGLFMTAEDLARWCQLLFERKVLKPSSLDQMLTIGKGGYGLGVQVRVFRRGLMGREKAFGHGGGNIGAMAYMWYLPEHHTSIALMINAFNGKCINYIIKELVSITVEHLSSQNSK